MKRDQYIFWGVAALLLFGGGTVVYSKIRGIRNNNPGNIRLTNPPTPWVGAVTPNTDGDFVQFDTPEHGIRALAIILLHDVANGFRTPNQIIRRYSATDQDAYVQNFADALGIDPDGEVSFPDQLPDAIGAIVSQENGINPYSDATIAAGIAMAG